MELPKARSVVVAFGVVGWLTPSEEGAFEEEEVLESGDLDRSKVREATTGDATCSGDAKFSITIELSLLPRLIKVPGSCNV